MPLPVSSCASVNLLCFCQSHVLLPVSCASASLICFCQPPLCASANLMCFCQPPLCASASIMSFCQPPVCASASHLYVLLPARWLCLCQPPVCASASQLMCNCTFASHLCLCLRLPPVINLPSGHGHLRHSMPNCTSTTKTNKKILAHFPFVPCLL